MNLIPNVIEESDLGLSQSHGDGRSHLACIAYTGDDTIDPSARAFASVRNRFFNHVQYIPTGFNPVPNQLLNHVRYTLIDSQGKTSLLNSPESFFAQLQVRYLPSLEYKDQNTKLILDQKYEKALRKKWITQRQKWLGQYYSFVLDREHRGDFTIAWLGEEVGYGVFTNAPIAKRAFIGEYTGILRKRRFFKRWENLYCFDYTVGESRSSSYVIDAKEAGNHTRFINHSFSPNLGLVSVDDGSKIRVLLYAERAIQSGEQLFYDYGEEYWEKRPPPHVLISTRS